MQKLIVAVVIGLGVVAGLPVEAQAQATAKPQFIWNQQEREAVDAVKAWVNAWSTKDPQRVAELMADNSVFRADPAAPMKTGREAFVALITPLMPRVDSMTIDEIYVTGTEWDSAVMIKRSDKMSATAGAALAGRTVTVAAFFRAKNRKITEWLDTPVLAPAQAPQ
jgi:uncharacterized protein (TIGR02246 family)